MEYIISGASAPAGDIYDDETYCTRGLCAHPCCWESHIRQTRGFRKYVSLPDDVLYSHARAETKDDSHSDEGISSIFIFCDSNHYYHIVFAIK